MNETLNTIEVGNYRLSRADERNIEVEEFKTVKAKRGRFVKEARETDKWVSRGFFSSVSEAARAIIGWQADAAVEQSNDLKEIVTFVAESKDEVVKAVQGAGLTLESMNRHVKL